MSQWQSQTRKMNRHYQSVKSTTPVIIGEDIPIWGVIHNDKIALWAYRYDVPYDVSLELANNFDDLTETGTTVSHNRVLQAGTINIERISHVNPSQLYRRRVSDYNGTGYSYTYTDTIYTGNLTPHVVLSAPDTVADTTSNFSYKELSSINGGWAFDENGTTYSNAETHTYKCNLYNEVGTVIIPNVSLCIKYTIEIADGASLPDIYDISWFPETTLTGVSPGIVQPTLKLDKNDKICVPYGNDPYIGSTPSLNLDLRERGTINLENVRGGYDTSNSSDWNHITGNNNVEWSYDSDFEAWTGGDIGTTVYNQWYNFNSYRLLPKYGLAGVWTQPRHFFVAMSSNNTYKYSLYGDDYNIVGMGQTIFNTPTPGRSTVAPSRYPTADTSGPGAVIVSSYDDDDKLLYGIKAQPYYIINDITLQDDFQFCRAPSYLSDNE